MVLFIFPPFVPLACSTAPTHSGFLPCPSQHHSLEKPFERKRRSRGCLRWMNRGRFSSKTVSRLIKPQLGKTSPPCSAGAQAQAAQLLQAQPQPSFCSRTRLPGIPRFQTVLTERTSLSQPQHLRKPSWSPLQPPQGPGSPFHLGRDNASTGTSQLSARCWAGQETEPVPNSSPNAAAHQPALPLRSRPGTGELGSPRSIFRRALRLFIGLLSS